MLKLFKVLVSVGLISLLLYNVDWVLLSSSLRSLDWLVILAVISVFSLQFPVSTLKWQYALKLHGLGYPFLYLQKVLCIGFFFNNFLPSTIGGDAYRILKTVPDEGYKSRAVSAVLLERIVGLLALLSIGFVGAVYLLHDAPNPLVVSYVVAGLSAVAAVVVVLFLHKLGMFRHVAKRLSHVKAVDILLHNLGHIQRNPGMLFKVVMVSIVFQVLAVLAIGLLFANLGVGGGYAQYALIAAVAGLASVAPVSINGIGVVEGAFAVTAVQLQMGYNEALVVAFVMRVMVAPLSLLCGLVYLWDLRRQARS